MSILHLLCMSLPLCVFQESSNVWRQSGKLSQKRHSENCFYTDAFILLSKMKRKTNQTIFTFITLSEYSNNLMLLTTCLSCKFSYKHIINPAKSIYSMCEEFDSQIEHECCNILCVLRILCKIKSVDMKYKVMFNETCLLFSDFVFWQKKMLRSIAIAIFL